MMNNPLWRRVAISAVLLSVAVACGSSDDDGVDGASTTAGGAEGGTTAPSTSSTSSTPSTLVEAGGSCVPGEGDLPMSTALEPGPSAGAYYDTVSPFEYADMERTHIHPADFYFGAPGEECVVASRALDGMHLNSYNIVTRDRGEAFLYGTEPEPYVVKFDLDSGAVMWETALPTIDDNFAWVGLVVTHGNGDIYAVHSRTLVRIDPASGEILARADLPPVSGTLASDTVYNGFTVAPNGLIVAKSYGRPAGCAENGTAAITECVNEDNPQPRSAIVTLDPITLEVLSTVELPEVATGRPAVAEFEDDVFVYLNGADNVYRIRLDGSDLTVDDTWQFGGFLTDGQTGSSSVVVMGDWVAFQTNGTPSTALMTVYVVSQADDTVSTSLDPFTPAPGPSFTPSSLTADPTSMSIYSQDGGRGQIAGLDFDEASVELTEKWVVDQRTINHLTLIGPPEERVLVSTDAPDVLTGLASGVDYDEQVVWRSADTGEERARSEILPNTFIGGPVTPGFEGAHFYLGLDGTIRELFATCPDPVCD